MSKSGNMTEMKRGNTLDKTSTEEVSLSEDEEDAEDVCYICERGLGEKD
jgi:hypothetical protein